MKKFALKITLFLFLFVAFGRLLSVFLPYHFGNPWFGSKVNYLNSDASPKFNTYFFGSSRIYRQVDPHLFDSVVNTKQSKEMRSFNLGSPATFVPQVYFLYQNFLKSALSKNAKYCIVELTEIDTISNFFLHNEKSTYWQTPFFVDLAARSFKDNPDLNSIEKTKYTYRSYLSYAENVLHLGQLKQFLLDPNYYNNNCLGEDVNGYYPLQREMDNATSVDIKKYYLMRKNMLVKRPQDLEERRAISIEYNQNVTQDYDKVHLAYILDLLKQAEEKSIKLIFVLAPRVRSKRLVNLGYQIPKNHFIDLSSAEQYKDLYSVKNSFDIGHLNTPGSKLFTIYLAQAFSALAKE